MQLTNHLHLAYCTNIHRGQDWPQTFQTLQEHTLRVRDRVSPGKPYAIGLRLSHNAAVQLSDRETLNAFRSWLDKENCYVFTINGFPYGTFHGGRVKELAYVPDWTTTERLEYTKLLFELLAELVPAGLTGSVSTVPGSFKPLIQTQEQVEQMRKHLWLAVEHIEQVSRRSGKHLHLGLEPEPCCYLETSQETCEFFEEMRQDRPDDERLSRFLGVNYDCCHFAVEYENPDTALERFLTNGIFISKLHLSSALKVKPSPESRAALASFIDPVYFHQVIARVSSSEEPALPTGGYTRYLDLDQALASQSQGEEEWRIHFHIPLHCKPSDLFETTTDHLLGVLDVLQQKPEICSHLEMETYTWEVLPPEMKNRDVAEQLSAEYRWTLDQLARRGLA